MDESTVDLFGRDTPTIPAGGYPRVGCPHEGLPRRISAEDVLTKDFPVFKDVSRRISAKDILRGRAFTGNPSQGDPLRKSFAGTSLVGYPSQGHPSRDILRGMSFARTSLVGYPK